MIIIRGEIILIRSYIHLYRFIRDENKSLLYIWQLCWSTSHCSFGVEANVLELEVDPELPNPSPSYLVSAHCLARKSAKTLQIIKKYANVFPVILGIRFLPFLFTPPAHFPRILTHLNMSNMVDTLTRMIWSYAMQITNYRPAWEGKVKLYFNTEVHLAQWSRLCSHFAVPELGVRVRF